LIHDGRRCEDRLTWPHPAAQSRNRGQPLGLDENKFRIFGAGRADATGLGEREARVEELALPKSVESGKLSLEIC
jgi:hypothetical protein